MGLKESVKYHLGVDFLAQRRQEELAHLRTITNTENPLPFDAGLGNALEIYRDRMVTAVAYPGVVILRAMGTDIIED